MSDYQILHLVIELLLLLLAAINGDVYKRQVYDSLNHKK